MPTSRMRETLEPVGGEGGTARICADQGQLCGAEAQTQLHDQGPRRRLGQRSWASETDASTDRHCDRRILDHTASFAELPPTGIISAAAAHLTGRPACADDYGCDRVERLSA
ncbi:hypothetical protein, partial [Microbacterium sp. BF1]|uniref:hypothetical protein n=1 Tax=Microbacterium sp. BF1 TaxID=2821146 RepID=UPI00211A83D6